MGRSEAYYITPGQIYVWAACCSTDLAAALEPINAWREEADVLLAANVSSPLAPRAQAEHAPAEYAHIHWRLVAAAEATAECRRSVVRAAGLAEERIRAASQKQ